MVARSASATEVNAFLIDLRNSFSSVRQIIKPLRQNDTMLDTKDGISLMSLKQNILLLYLRSLSLNTSRRAIGHHLNSRSPPSQAIGALNRSARGSGAGDLVDAMIEYRVMLEKMKALEGRMRHQIEKLVRLAQKPDKGGKLIDDPLAFRPNPQNFLEPSDENDASDIVKSGATDTRDEIYQPPRLAPVPYIEPLKARRKQRAPIPSALAALSSDPTRPDMESTSGLGSVVAVSSSRAAHLKQLQEYEEDTFSRLVMKKADARRRARDEADLALGGGLGASGRKAGMQAGTLEDAFDDVLKGIERRGRMEEGHIKDGYEELRKKGREGSALERSRRVNDAGKRGAGSGDEGGENSTKRKRTRFELDTKKRLSKRRR
ncbi:hypothetical protein APHAL10511_001263 [Amanita phalloides]|nr:hypothetical protein APHAL10511_001263 [Amanita phalloides]